MNMKPVASIGWRAAAAAVIALGLARSAGAETITVTHWGAAFYGAPYAVAIAKGFFKQRGVDISGVLTSTGGGTSVRNTLAGDLPYGEVALPAEMTQTVGIVTDELAKSGAARIRAIIDGRREGVKFIEAHPDEAADIVAKTYNIDPALTREVFRHFLEIKYWSEGALNYAAM